MVRFDCSWCGKANAKTGGQPQRSMRLGLPLYCNRHCAGLARRTNRTKAELGRPDPRSPSRPCPWCDGTGEIVLAADPYEDHEPDVRIMDCDCCEGIGQSESAPYGYDPRNGALLTHSEICHVCEGSGRQLVEMQPITQEDLR